MVGNDKVNSASDRLFEEQLYEQVSHEIQRGELKPGLWAKALAKSSGNNEAAKSHYIEFRVQAIKDEIVIAENAAENLRNKSPAPKTKEEIKEEKLALKKEKARNKAKAYAIRHAEKDDSSGCLFFFKALGICLVIICLFFSLGFAVSAKDDDKDVGHYQLTKILLKIR